MKSRFWTAVVIAVAVVVMCNAGATRLLPRVPNCFDAPRNPFRFRGWPEYLTGLKHSATGAATVVLLTNSQGYASEYPAAKGYAQRLEQLLTAQRVGGFGRWKVMNMGIDGVTSIEYMLLAALAQSAHPTLVVAVTGFADYRSAHYKAGFGTCRSDVPRLISRWNVAKRLPPAYLRRHIRIEDTLAAWASDRLALLRLKEYMWCWLDARCPGSHQILYAPLVNYHPWELHMRSKKTGLQLKQKPEEWLDLTYAGGGQQMLREYLHALSGFACPTVVVSAPHRLSATEERAEQDRLFQADVARVAPEMRLAFWDLHESLPPEDFLDATHFNARNHERFANALAARIAGLWAEEKKAP